MTDLLIAFGIGVIFGYLFKTNKSNINLELYTKVSELEKDLTYYRRLCKEVSEENMEFRRKQ